MSQIAFPPGFQTAFFNMSYESYQRDAQDEEPNSYAAFGPYLLQNTSVSVATHAEPIGYQHSSASHNIDPRSYMEPFNSFGRNLATSQSWAEDAQPFATASDINPVWGRDEQNYNGLSLAPPTTGYYSMGYTSMTMDRDSHVPPTTGVESQLDDLTIASQAEDMSETESHLPALQMSQHEASDHEASPSSAPYHCQSCVETFANQKNLERHFLSGKHNSDVAKFKCACGFMQARKDNYRRHLQTCTFHIDFVYQCSCGEITQNKAVHENHIDLCGRKRRNKNK